ncbi:MAG: GNAT family N-acetyltransferase [Methanobacteriaceae archaeon]|nr:GNAT family N-acetyltransferase [Methanobacteriaceae archaeon]
MSIKAAVKNHFINHLFKEDGGNLSFQEHLANNSKIHGDYFIQDKTEDGALGEIHQEKLVFRRFSWEDFDESAELFKKVFNAGPWYDNWRSLDEVRNYLGELASNPVFEGFIVQENSHIIAACMGRRRSWWNGKEFFVDEFLVENDMQGEGIGTKLMNFVSQSLLKEGYTRIILFTNKGIPAEIFYLKNGFYNNQNRTVMVKEL